MGNHPFLKYANGYLDTVRGYLADETVKCLARRFNRMDRDVERLVSEGLIKTASPAKWSMNDMLAYVNYRYSLNLSLAEVKHDLGALKKVMIEAGSYKVFTEVLSKHPNISPIHYKKRLPPIGDADYETFKTGMTVIDEKDYLELRRYLVMSLSVFCGLRSKELRLASIDDIIIEKDGARRFNVVHVKGERTYGESRVVPIPEVLHHLFDTYLDARRVYLGEENAKNKYLFPSRTSSKGHLASNTIRSDVSKVAKQLGVGFNLRDGRRTFGQRYLDKDLAIEKLSVLMGHSSTKTTELFYSRTKNSVAVDAAEELENVW